MALAASLAATPPNQKGWEGSSNSANDADIILADPGANCLLIFGVTGCGTSGGADDAAWFSSGSSVAGGSLTWTQIGFSTDANAYVCTAGAYSAMATGAPGGFTADFTAAPTHTFEDCNMFSFVVKATGHDTGTPIGGKVFSKFAGSLSNGAQSVTLDAAPATDDFVLVFVHADQGSPTTSTPNTGAGGTWTNLYTNTSGTHDQVCYIGYRTGSTSTTVAFSDLNTGGDEFTATVSAFVIKASAGGGASSAAPSGLIIPPTRATGRASSW